MRKQIAIFFIASIFGLFTSFSSVAHTPLKKSFPSSGQVLKSAPAEIRLEYGAAVNLMSLKLTNSANELIEIDFSAPQEMKSAFQHAIPKLEDGKYTIEWRAMGKDSHRLMGKYRFTIDPLATTNNAKSSTSKESPEKPTHQHSND